MAAAHLHGGARASRLQVDTCMSLVSLVHRRAHRNSPLPLRHHERGHPRAPALPRWPPCARRWRSLLPGQPGQQAARAYRRCARALPGWCGRAWCRAARRACCRGCCSPNARHSCRCRCCCRGWVMENSLCRSAPGRRRCCPCCRVRAILRHSRGRRRLGRCHPARRCCRRCRVGLKGQLLPRQRVCLHERRPPRLRPRLGGAEEQQQRWQLPAAYRWAPSWLRHHRSRVLEARR